MSEKALFAERLKAAMVASGHEPRPSVLEKHFNSLYWGRSVTFQAARSWLTGRAIPEQDKLQVLAEWLRVNPQALRFGEKSVPREAAKTFIAAEPLSPQDRAAIDALLALPPARRKLVGELIRALTTTS